MSQITRFQIQKLHGSKDLDLRLKDNTLILVGENGAGKTTVLQLFYYLLSGQWSSMAKYQFESVTITIDAKKHSLRYADIEKSLHGIDRRILHRLPLSVRRRVLALLEHSEGRLASGELEALCEQFDIPLHYLLRELDLVDYSNRKETGPLRSVLKAIHESLNAQLLYLPTYRRIEQELSLIFKGLDERELSNRRAMLGARKRGGTYVELVEFGMKDVESAVNEARAELDKFARENLTKLTFTYLGDIVEQRYESVELDPIQSAEPKTIDNILNRIPESILSAKSKQQLREIINAVKAESSLGVHSQVIGHYFTKLMAFHQELELREAKLVNFCRACNEYLVDKEFRYDTTNYTFSIVPTGSAEAAGDIKLQHLSSGEKQVVSLFSHLHLSGGERYFVLIDEPELSLSVVWQRRFLLDIRDADFCSGLVAVTHSPFIYDNDLRKYAHGLGEFIV